MSELKTEREKILYNMYLHECQKSEKMKSFFYRLKLGWFKFKKRFRK